MARHARDNNEQQEGGAPEQPDGPTWQDPGARQGEQPTGADAEEASGGVDAARPEAGDSAGDE